MRDDDARQNDPADDGVMSRRSFGKVTAAAMMAALVPALPAHFGRLLGDAPLSARLVSDRTETLPGGTRRTFTIEYSNLPGTQHTSGGWSGRQTTVMTKRDVAGGDVIAYDITFEPPLPTADGQLRVSSSHSTYEFTHGAVQGDKRQDMVRVTSEFGGRRQSFTRRVLRPLTPPSISGEEQLRMVVEMLNRDPQMHPEGVPGALQLI